MKLIHEDLPDEAKITARALKKVFDIKSDINNANLDGLFVSINSFNGYLVYSQKLSEISKLPKMHLIVTPKDLYVADKNREEDWVFGCHSGNLIVLSTARLKRQDSLPSIKLLIPSKHYEKRIEAMSIHEVGHDVVKGDHLQEAYFVNAKNGYRLPLGPHCTDPRCIMYEIIDVKTPAKEESYLEIGGKEKFDAGLDDLIERLYPRFFCEKCLSNIKIEKKYD
ncbi:MAG: hypothetical protein QXP53_03055 [Candidatus Pacearchaeota archaeon]